MIKLRPKIAVPENPTLADFSSADQLLQELLDRTLLRPDDWDNLLIPVQEELSRQPNCTLLLRKLVEKGLLTEYQAERIGQGGTAQLMLGNYRVLDLLGVGGMASVFKAEHRLLRRPVAIKVMVLARTDDPKVLERFLSEMWIVGQLQHPNIVTALDAGELPSTSIDVSRIQYLVMEYIPGQDLEQRVKGQGPLDPSFACDLIYQVADALDEAHKHHLVHRDVKPSNIRVTPEGQSKLLDFGMAQYLRKRHTEPGAVLGSVAYLAPEQAQDSRTVDIRADIFALGGTLFWCLTGRPPFAVTGNALVELAKRLNQAPPLVRAVRPEISPALEAVVTAMMATNPDDRYATPKAVKQALSPFLKRVPRSLGVPSDLSFPEGSLTAPGASAGRSDTHQVLIVDDEPDYRNLCQLVLEGAGLECHQADNGKTALAALGNQHCDLVLLDIDMPEMTGIQVLHRLREEPPYPNLKVIMASGRASPDEMAEMMLAGADDYLTKPFSPAQLKARVKVALRLKDAQERSHLLFQGLLATNHELEQTLHTRDSDLIHARNALVLSLAELVAHRDNESGAHLLRIQRYCRLLAELAATVPAFAPQIDGHFINMLECCAPLHDIGKAGVPDCILLKPGQLTLEERLIMQTHTTIGASILQKVARQHPFAHSFLQMATDITRHHHERFDGRGYPDGLAGEAIPLAARLVTISDVYDALRSRRVYKPALPHTDALRVMLEESPGHFDPALLHVFKQGAHQFEQLFHQLTE
jgi:putative two-component system response regulator